MSQHKKWPLSSYSSFLFTHLQLTDISQVKKSLVYTVHQLKMLESQRWPHELLDTQGWVLTIIIIVLHHPFPASRTMNSNACEHSDLQPLDGGYKKRFIRQHPPCVYPQSVWHVSPHVTTSPRPFPYCKQSKSGGGNGLGIRLWIIASC